MQETQQLLDDSKLLYDDVCLMLEDNKELRDSLQAKEERICELEQRIADLEHAALTVNGPYIANQQIRKQIVTMPHLRKIGHSQKNNDSSQQLKLCL